MAGRRGGRRRFGRPPEFRILATEPVPRGFIPSTARTWDSFFVPPDGTPSTPIQMTADEYYDYRLTKYEGLSHEDPRWRQRFVLEFPKGIVSAYE